jgi:hypothetical protein
VCWTYLRAFFGLLHFDPSILKSFASFCEGFERSTGLIGCFSHQRTRLSNCTLTFVTTPMISPIPKKFRFRGSLGSGKPRRGGRFVLKSHASDSVLPALRRGRDCWVAALDGFIDGDHFDDPCG